MKPDILVVVGICFGYVAPIFLFTGTATIVVVVVAVAVVADVTVVVVTLAMADIVLVFDTFFYSLLSFFSLSICLSLCLSRSFSHAILPSPPSSYAFPLNLFPFSFPTHSLLLHHCDYIFLKSLAFS